MSDRKPAYFRMDFRQHIEGRNPDGSFRVRIEPDPERYERITRRGRSHLRDRFTNLILDERKFFEVLVQRLKGMPIYFEPAEIDEPGNYVLERIPAIKSMLRGEGEPIGISSSAHDELLTRIGENRRFAIVTLVLHNHLEIASLHRKRRRAVNTVISHEIAMVAALHRGSLWKSTTISLSLFFPAPSINSKTDLSLGFAAAARDLISVINLQLRENGLPSLLYSIGLEAGDAEAEISGLEEIHTQVDLAGLVVSATEEIARAAMPGCIWVGPRAADGCHVSWRKQMCKVVPQPAIELMDDFGNIGIVRELSPNAHGTGPLLNDAAGNI